MLKKKYLRKTALVLFVFQMLFGSVFGYSTMTMGLASTTSLSDNSTVRQKAYCEGTGYAIMIPDATNQDVDVVNMVLGFQTGDTDISPSSWTYTSFARPGANDARVPDPAVIVYSGILGFTALPAGYFLQAGGRNTDVSPAIFYTSPFSLGYLTFTNSFGVTGTFFKYNVDPNYMGSNWSSRMAITNLSSGYSYQLNYKFIPEPCDVDNNAPLGGSYFPSNSISDHAAIDSGVRFMITDAQSIPVTESYAYTSGNPKENTVDDPLTTAYAATGTTNQWGIDTGSIRIILTYTGVARGTIDQRGTGITITKVFSGSDLVFDYLTGLGNVPVRTWNRNYLGSYVSVNPSVLSTLLDFRKETLASIRYTGADWANSLPAITNASGTARLGANIFDSTAFTFNAGTSNTPDAYIGRSIADLAFDPAQSNPGSGAIQGASNQISGLRNTFYFKWTDNRAGVAMNESGRVKVEVYHSTNTVQSSYKTSFGSPDSSYTFSGSELNLAAFNGSGDQPDYTGFISLSDGGITLQTGDRVKVTTFVVDYVGNTRTSDKWFDMQDYPPRPADETITIHLENHGAVISSKVTTSPQSTTLADYYSTYPSLSGFTYLGQVDNTFTGTDGISTLTGVLLTAGLLTGFANVDTGLSVTKTFSFPIIVQNIYNQTGTLTFNVTVEPGCSEGAGCGPKLMIYTGTSLAEAEANPNGIRYNNRFIKIDSSDRPVLTGTADHAILYCAGSGAITTVDISNLDYPAISNSPYADLQTFSGSTLIVSGNYSNGLSGVIYTGGHIYLFRDLTGGIDYNTGEYISGTSQINRTRNQIITGTITITGGYITGDNLGIFIGPVIELGGGRRTYTYVSTDSTGFDIFVENRWDSSGTQDVRYYQTGTLRFNNSWIDLTPPDMTGSNSCQSPHTGTIVLESQLTGYGPMFSDNLTYLTSDDDTFIITAITTGTDFTTFGDNQSDGAFIYDINANSGTRELTKNITFTGNWSGYAHVQDKAGNTGSIFVETTCIQGAEVTVYAIPGYRDPNNYAFTGMVSIYTISAGGTGELYSIYTGAFSNTGIGQFTLPRPLYGQSIGVVLQSSIHLPSLGFTGTLTETGTNFFDFTIWTGLDAQMYTSGWFDAVDLSSIGLGVRSLLVPGDVYKTDNDGGTGSIINAFDMAVINDNLTLDANTTSGAIDFDNKGGIISSFEQAVIIQNLQRQGRDLDLDKFDGLHYVQ